MSTRRVVLVGALSAVVAAAALVALVATGVVAPPRQIDATREGPVLVALVLPDEVGVVQPRVVEVFRRSSGAWTYESVSPTMAAVVSGTTGRTLADAYSFGGGRALSAAFAAGTHSVPTAWVVIDSGGWERLADGASLTLDLPSDIEVFDGSRLIEFRSGVQSVEASQVASLLRGSEYLGEAESERVRAAVGSALAERLSAAAGGSLDGVSSSVPTAELTEWLRGLGSPKRVPGS